MLSYLIFFLLGAHVFGNSTEYFDEGGCPCEDNEALGVSYNDQFCLCKCIKPYEMHHFHCMPCAANFVGCSSICCQIQNTVCNNNTCTYTDGLDFVTAAKVVVLFALVVTCVAVLIALLRAFLIPRCCRRRSADPDSRSLNSVQRFVLERLRNSPPSYDYQPEKPPSYEECVVEAPTEAIPEESPPPAYGVAVISSMPGVIMRQMPRESTPPPYSLRPTTSVSPLILNARSLPVPSPVSGMTDFALLEVTSSGISESLTDLGVDNVCYETEDVVFSSSESTLRTISSSSRESYVEKTVDIKINEKTVMEIPNDDNSSAQRTEP